MAYEAPTAADLKARFPAFDGVNDDVVNSALSEAALQVDESWVSQAAFTLGRLLYAAHVLTLDGLGTGFEAKAAASGALGFTSMKSGDLTLSRETGAAGANGGTVDTLMQTQYGRRFADLQRQNVGGPIAIGGC